MGTSNSKSVVYVFIFFILLLSGWLTFGMFGFVKGLRAKNWPTTQGVVVSSQVIKPTGKSTKYIAEIIYSYKVNDKEYKSDSYKASAARGTSQWAKELIEQHPVNSGVLVHYNPNKPTEAVVEPGLQSDNYIMTFVPMIMILVLIKVLRKQVKDRKNVVENIVTG